MSNFIKKSILKKFQLTDWFVSVNFAGCLWAVLATMLWTMLPVQLPLWKVTINLAIFHVTNNELVRVSSSSQISLEYRDYYQINLPYFTVLKNPETAFFHMKYDPRAFRIDLILSHISLMYICNISQELNDYASLLYLGQVCTQDMCITI